MVDVMWGCPWCGGFGYGWGGWFLALLWFLLLAWLIWAFVRAISGNPKTHEGGKDRALEILRERYARGEIDRETFERMKRDLGG